MQTPLRTLAPDSVQQIRDALRRVRTMHHAMSPGGEPKKAFWSVVELPKPDAVAWEDTEIDVRRVVL